MQDCNFHECAKLDEFESMRQLSFTPPDGEFVLLNYRINAEFRCPFRLFPSIADIDPYRYFIVIGFFSSISWYHMVCALVC